jgi:16S rRNA (cytidine1402-2'-O)-methyltransferase
MSLYVVATPIGNLADLTYRAVETLRSVACIAAEDTRTSGKLLKHYGITTPTVAYHAHSTPAATERLVARLRAGEDLALISDAGTPGISDPGYRLVTAAIAAGVTVVPVPGVSAVVTALSASGLPTDKFLYLGFLPMKKGRQTIFRILATEERTVVFYESVHRIERTLAELSTALGGERRCVVARELTKLHEEFVRGTLAEVAAYFHQKTPRGEFVVLLAPVGY